MPKDPTSVLFSCLRRERESEKERGRGCEKDIKLFGSILSKGKKSSKAIPIRSIQ